MARGKEIAPWIRHVALAYKIQLGMSDAEIGRKLDVNPKALNFMIKRAKDRCGGSEDLATLQAAVVVQPRCGRKRRAEPGSQLSLAVREAIRKSPEKKFVEAANDEIRRLKELGELDPDEKPLGDAQVYHILQDPEHCKMDPRGKKRILLKREYKRDSKREKSNKKTDDASPSPNDNDHHLPQQQLLQHPVSEQHHHEQHVHDPRLHERNIHEQHLHGRHRPEHHQAPADFTALSRAMLPTQTPMALPYQHA